MSCRWSPFLALLFLVATLLVGFHPTAVSAQTTRDLARAIRCAPVVVDTKTGLVTQDQSKDPRFLCFRTRTEAKRAGFLELKPAERLNLTGWYQLRLDRRVRNTCERNSSRSGPVLFFQLRDAREGVFGQFCPSFGTYTGFREGSGFTISGEQLANENPDTSICDDGRVRIQRFVKLVRTGATLGKPSFSADYREIVSCQSESSGASVCRREFTGIAVPETHRIWPTVPANIQYLTAGCSHALTTCAGCHPGIDFGGLRP